MQSILFSILLVSVSAFAQNNASRLITVSGTAVTYAVPDLQNWSVQVQTLHSELPKAAEIHAKKSEELIAALKAHGIPEKDIQTANMEFGENKVYRDRSYVKDGYKATTDVSFKLSDLSKYKAIWLSLASLRGVSVKQVSYDLNKRIDIQNDTRKKALLAAKAKAQSMVEVLGSKLGEVHSIAEDSNAGNSFRGNNSISNAVSFDRLLPEQSEDFVAPGTVPVRIQVTVAFELTRD